MDTFIVTWNPDKWPTTEVERRRFERKWHRDASATAAGRALEDRWSTGVRNSGIEVGDRVFMLRQHRDRGLVAAGEFRSAAFLDEHWDGSGREANYADILWDTVLDIDDRLQVEIVKERVPRVNWKMQGGGVRLKLRDALAVEALWEEHLDGMGRQVSWLPEEVRRSETYAEGAVERVEVNRYERDPRAREACLNHWGHLCVVCGFDFERHYGTLGKAYIHVHHLRDLSMLGSGYLLHPIQDLRPVCPNCHAMLHQERPALTISALRNILRRADRRAP